MMGFNFFHKQLNLQQELYIELLQITGALSNLFAESKTPFLYYRTMENIFCKSFDADNLSRSDVSVDAGKGKVGIGLKTFLHQNGKTFQKVAEFNRESYLYRDLEKEDIIIKISELRNERIKSTKRICDLNDMMYHFVTRHSGEMRIYEETMDLIDIENIRPLSNNKSKNTIHFTDGLNNYNFSLSKSTLLKRFDLQDILPMKTFPVEILQDPFEFLLKHKNNLITKGEFDPNVRIEDYIVLPLYSYKSGVVEEKSGLNMWNAGGRKRDENEVYIPIPSFIHKKNPGFFKYKDDESRNTDSFKVILPNKRKLSMKVTQGGGKALQSDPNKELGKWILRDVLQIPGKQLASKEMLDEIGVDSVQLSKVKENLYYLDFLKTGSFEEYFDSLVEED